MQPNNLHNALTIWLSNLGGWEVGGARDSLGTIVSSKFSIIYLYRDVLNVTGDIFGNFIESLNNAEVYPPSQPWFQATWVRPDLS